MSPLRDSDSADPTLGAVLAAGQRVLRRYVLQNELGRGGMGVVWRA